jgi:hypothetical protein
MSLVELREKVRVAFKEMVEAKSETSFDAEVYKSKLDAFIAADDAYITARKPLENRRDGR